MHVIYELPDPAHTRSGLRVYAPAEVPEALVVAVVLDGTANEIVIGADDAVELAAKLLVHFHDAALRHVVMLDALLGRTGSGGAEA